MLPLASFIALAALQALPARGDTVRFTPAVGYPTFAVREPVLRIRPGTVLISNTMWGAYYSREGGAWPGEVGPVFIEGATTNDILVVKIVRVRPNTDLAAARINPAFGGLQTDARVRLLNDAIPARRYVWELDRQRMTGTTTLPDSRMRTVTIVENDEHIMVAGSGRPLMDAYRLAQVELIE
jgi:hypothetical protein